MTPERACALMLAALVVLRLAWPDLSGAVAPDRFAAALLTLLPLLPFLAAWVFRLRGLWIYGGIAVLVYFCHGVMEAWVLPQQRWLALTEVVLSLGYFAAVYWRTALQRRARVRGGTR